MHSAIQVHLKICNFCQHFKLFLAKAEALLKFSVKNILPPAAPALCQGLEQTLRANPPFPAIIWELTALVPGMRFPAADATTTSDTRSISFPLCFVPSLPVPAPQGTGLAPGCVP